MSSVFWLIVIGVLVAPFLAYYVAKFAVVGCLMGLRSFRDYEKEKRDGEDQREARS